jgi:2'-5' RNA ligase
MRLFVALELPDPVHREIERLVLRLQRELPRARGVRPEGVHLTLCFLGETDGRQLTPLLEAIRLAFGRHPPLRLRVAGGGTFPAGRPARVAWLGVEAPAELAELQADVSRAAVFAAGIQPESRPFHPHLTLARPIEPWPRPTAERFAAAARRSFGEAFEVGRGVLMESHLGSGGSRYEVVESFSLEGASR